MRRWPFVVVVLGLALQIAAWVLVIPPYGTYDEFDHVYRASSVWHGQLTEVRDAPDEYSQPVIADPNLVNAGFLECMRLPYTRNIDCHAGPPMRDDTVLVRSGAARYNPLYYLAIGPATQLGSGSATVLWMRIWSSILTVAVLSWAVMQLRGWPRPAQGIRGLMVAYTPMVAASCAIVAPNGLEMAAGLLWWTSLLTLTQAQPTGRSLWLALATSGILLAQLRSLGPFYLLVTLSVIAVWKGRALREAINENRRPAVAAAGALGLSLASSALWVLTQHAKSFNDPPWAPSATWSDSVSQSFASVPGWMVQFIAALPGRNIAPPPLVTAGWLVPLTLLALNAALRNRRARWSLAALCSVVLGFPIVFSILTFREFGLAWQSRYILPLAIGIPLLLALNGRQDRSRLLINDVVLIVGALIAQIVIARFTQQWYARISPSVTLEQSFPITSDWVPLAFLAFGTAAVGLILLRLSAADTREQPAAGINQADSASPALPRPVPSR